MVLELNKLLNKYALSEPDYQKLKAFFNADLSFAKLTKLQQGIIDAIDRPKIDLPVDVLEKVEVLKTRLLSENILARTELESLEKSSYLFNKISSGKDFTFADVKVTDVNAMWQKRLDNLFKEAQKDLPAEIRKLPLAQQQAAFRKSLQEELKSSDSQLAQQWRADYHVAEPKIREDFLDKLFQQEKKNFTPDVRALPIDEQQSRFRAAFMEMVSDPNVKVDWDRMEVAWRGFNLSQLAGLGAPDRAKISRLGKNAFWSDKAREEFEKDVDANVLTSNYKGLTLAEKSKLYRKEFYEKMSRDMSPDGKQFRKDLGIPESTDPDEIHRNLTKTMAGWESDKQLYQIFQEHPELSNKELLRYSEKGSKYRRGVRPNESIDAYLDRVDRIESSYAPNYKVWNKARADRDLIRRSEAQEIEMSKIDKPKPYEWNEMEELDPKFAQKIRGTARKPFSYHPDEPEVGSKAWLEDFKGSFRENPSAFLLGAEAKPPSGFDLALKHYIEANPEVMAIDSTGRFSIAAGKFNKWVEGTDFANIAKGVGVGIAVGALTTFIAKWAHLSKEDEDQLDFVVTESLAGLQLGLELAGGGGPVGIAIATGALLALPIVKVYEMFKRPGQLLKEDDAPEKIYGTRFAWVRSFDPDDPTKVQWYPGIIAQKDPRTYGPLVRINYGKLKDLKFRIDKNGNFNPYFKNWRTKMFNASKADLTVKSSEKDRQRLDVIRDFSFFTKEESQAMFKKLANHEDISSIFQEHDDDRTQQPKYLQDLLEWRDFYEYQQVFNKGTDVETGRGLTPADRTFHREVLRGKFMDPSYAHGSQLWFDLMDDNKWKGALLKHRRQISENKALKELFRQQTHDLLRAQQLAANSNTNFIDSLKHVGTFTQKFNFMFYSIDTGFPPAETLAQLQEQHQKIDSRGDLSTFDKMYVQQKVMTRYLLNRLGDRYLGEDILRASMAEMPRKGGERFRRERNQKDPDTAVLDYRNLMSMSGVLDLGKVGKKNIIGNPPPIWLDSGEKMMPDWQVNKFVNKGETWYGGEQAEKLTVVSQNFIRPFLVGRDLGEAFRKANPQYFKEDPKFKGVIGKDKHMYSRKLEQYFEDTAEDKKKRLAEAKKLRLHPVKTYYGGKKTEDQAIQDKFGRGAHMMRDITDRQDAYYKADPNTTYDMFKKRWVLKTAKHDVNDRQDAFYKADPTTVYDLVKNQWVPKRKITRPEVPTVTFTDKFGKPDKFRFGKRDKKIEKKLTALEIAQKKLAQEKAFANASSQVVKKIVKKKDVPVVAPVVVAQGVVLHGRKEPHIHHHYGAVKQWLIEQRGLSPDIKLSKIKQEDYPNLSFDTHGHITLFDDPEVHIKYNIGSEYAAITDSFNNLQTMYQASEVMPKQIQTRRVQLSKHITPPPPPQVKVRTI